MINWLICRMTWRFISKRQRIMHGVEPWITSQHYYKDARCISDVCPVEGRSSSMAQSSRIVGRGSKTSWRSIFTVARASEDPLSFSSSFSFDQFISYAFLDIPMETDSLPLSISASPYCIIPVKLLHWPYQYGFCWLSSTTSLYTSVVLLHFYLWPHFLS